MVGTRNGICLDPGYVTRTKCSIGSPADVLPCRPSSFQSAVLDSNLSQQVLEGHSKVTRFRDATGDNLNYCTWRKCRGYYNSISTGKPHTQQIFPVLARLHNEHTRNFNPAVKRTSSTQCLFLRNGWSVMKGTPRRIWVQKGQLGP
jgi:hypothetical protein